MQTVLDDARESYKSDIIVELQSQNTEDLEENVNRIAHWIDSWLKNNAESYDRLEIQVPGGRSTGLGKIEMTV